MNILESIVFGIVSGFTEFLPISSLGHQSLLEIFFGATAPQPLRELFVHIGFIIAVFVCCGTYLEKLRRMRQQNKSQGRRTPQRDRMAYYDIGLLRSTTRIMILAMVLLRILFRPSHSLSLIAVCFFLNGLLIFIPEYMPHGNKDSHKLSMFDSFLLGIGSAVSVLPGFSRVGAALSCGVMRGADHTKLYNWILVLTLPATLLLLVFDLVDVFQFGFGIVGFTAFIGCFLSGVFSFISSVASVYFMRFLIIRSGFSAFAFYSWGAALLSFLLYLSA